jgi:hypothetical protein
MIARCILLWIRGLSYDLLAADIFVGNAPLGFDEVRFAITVLGSIQTGTSTIILLLFWVNFGNVAVKRKYACVFPIASRVWHAID